MNNRAIDQLKKPQGFFYGYIVIIVAFCIMVVMYGLRVSYGVFFKPMMSDFGWTRALTSGAYSISVLVQGLSAIVMGSIDDRFGPRVVLSLCGFLTGLGYLLMSQISTPWQLYLFYIVIIGTSMGGAFVPLASIVARWFIKRRSVMTGIIMAGLGTGSFILPPVANWLISTHGWRTSYIIVGCIALVVVVLAAQFLKRDPTQMGQVPYGEEKGGEQQLNLGTVGFSLKEAAYTYRFWMALVMFFCTGFCIVTLGVHIVPHATDLGISAATAANILAAMGGAGLIGGIVLGGAADRMGNRPVFVICFILMSASLFWLVPAREVWMLYLLISLLNFGGNGSATLEAPLIAELFGIRSHGLILGVASLAFTTGGAVGPYLTGYIFDVTGSYEPAFLICAAIGVVGIILAAILRPIKKLSTPESSPPFPLS